jgi:hypothetical protein
MTLLHGDREDLALWLLLWLGRRSDALAERAFPAPQGAGPARELFWGRSVFAFHGAGRAAGVSHRDPDVEQGV